MIRNSVGAIIAGVILYGAMVLTKSVLSGVISPATMPEFYAIAQLALALVFAWAVELIRQMVPPFNRDHRSIILFNGFALAQFLLFVTADSPSTLDQIRASASQFLLAFGPFYVVCWLLLFKRYFPIGKWHCPKLGEIRGVWDRETQTAVLLGHEQPILVGEAKSETEAQVQFCVLRLNSSTALANIDRLQSALNAPTNQMLVKKFRIQRPFWTRLRVMLVFGVVSYGLFGRQTPSSALIPGLVLYLGLTFLSGRLLLSHSKRGMRLMSQQDYPAAIAEFQTAHDFLTKRPWIERYQAFFILYGSPWRLREATLLYEAYCYAYLQDKAQAIAAFEQALKEYPASPIPQLALTLIQALESASEREGQYGGLPS